MHFVICIHCFTLAPYLEPAPIPPPKDLPPVVGSTHADIEPPIPPVAVADAQFEYEIPDFIDESEYIACTPTFEPPSTPIPWHIVM